MKLPGDPSCQIRLNSEDLFIGMCGRYVFTVSIQILLLIYSQWEASLSSSFQPGYIYPEDGLLQTLVSLYFDKMNTIFPLLHQPTFLQSLSQNQHRWDPAFGMTVLLVCAIGSRYTNDPRVTVPDDKHGLSSGWPYFSQVQIYRNPLLLNSTIYDLQYFVVCIFSAFRCA